MILPFKSSYWVVNNKLIAGEIPTAFDNQSTIEKLQGLVNANIGAIINLMEADERDYEGNEFYDYTDFLKQNNIFVHRYSIRDMDIPSPIQMARILKQIEYYIKLERIVYVHCWGGLGRTGTVVGCYLLSKGLAGANTIFDKINQLKSNSGLADKESPQTNSQREFILEFK